MMIDLVFLVVSCVLHIVHITTTIYSSSTTPLTLSMDSKTLQQPHQFDFESAGKVPDTHAWPTLMFHDYPSAEPSESEPVPIVDLSAPSRDAASQIGKACESWGAFRITGHDVDIGLLDRLEAEARRLFCLTTHRKLHAAKVPGSITGYGPPPISSFFPKLMWAEGFTISGSPVDHARKLWPRHYPRFCEVIEEYTEEMRRLAERIIQLMLISLGTTEEDIKWAPNDIAAALQLNSYPACPGPDRAMGLAAHTDSGLLTILHQSSDTRGLQLLRWDRWATVPPLAGTLVVVVGDLGHILSDGRFKSVLHRAVVNWTHHRISAAYLCGPPADAKVSPVGPGGAYRAVTWVEYLGHRVKFFDKALASIKITEDDTNNKKNDNGN